MVVTVCTTLMLLQSSVRLTKGNARFVFREGTTQKTVMIAILGVKPESSSL